LKEKETYNSSGNPTEVQTTSKKSPFFWFSVAKKNPKSKTDVTEFSKKKEKLVAESTKKKHLPTSKQVFGRSTGKKTSFSVKKNQKRPS